MKDCEEPFHQHSIDGIEIRVAVSAQPTVKMEAQPHVKTAEVVVPTPLHSGKNVTSGVRAYLQALNCLMKLLDWLREEQDMI